MGVSTSLAATRLSVMPGDSVSCSVQVRNSGQVVDQLTVDVLGDARAWSEVETPVLNLMPGQTSEVAIHFRPPRDSSVRAGVVPFGVRTLSREEPSTSRVEESELHVEAFTDVQVELSPKTSTCRRKARHEVIIDNLGNHPAAVELVPMQDDASLRFAVERAALTVEPGTAAFVKLTVQPEQKFLRGPERRLPFTISAVVGTLPPMDAEGAVLQRQLLPKWLLPALLGLLAVALALVALWFAVLKPTVQSAAKEAASDAAARQQAVLAEQAQQAQLAASSAERKANETKEKLDKAISGGKVGGGDEVKGPGGVDLTGGQSFDLRIPTDVPKNGKDYAPFNADAKIPAKKTLVVTDIVFQNPNGDGGTLELRRGADVLLVVGLNNFRDLDYHLTEPFVFPKGQRPVIAVNCVTPKGAHCRPAVSFSGRLVGK